MATIFWTKREIDNRVRALESTKGLLHCPKTSWTLVHKRLVIASEQQDSITLSPLIRYQVVLVTILPMTWRVAITYLNFLKLVNCLVNQLKNLFVCCLLMDTFYNSMHKELQYCYAVIVSRENRTRSLLSHENENTQKTKTMKTQSIAMYEGIQLNMLTL